MHVIREEILTKGHCPGVGIFMWYSWKCPNVYSVYYPLQAKN